MASPDSPPSTPSNRDPRDEADWRFETNGTACEWGESYHPGGYHPVVLGDVLNERYRIIRKLGYGAFSTTWLAVDQSSNCFVAVKVPVARLDPDTVDRNLAVYRSLSEIDDRHIVGLRDSFEVLGPNGRHTCLVMDPMGPHISALLKRRPEFQDQNLEPWDRRPRFPKSLAHRVLRDTLLGLHTLHQQGIVHGDLHPGNILANITIPSLRRPPDDSSALGLQQPASEGYLLRRLDGKVDRWAPLYLLEPSPLQELVSFQLDPVVKLADLGAAFFDRNPPATVVTPVALRAPEAILITAQIPFGKGVDIWAFGCLVFELLTGRALFMRLESLDGYAGSDEQTNDEHLIQVSEILGPLPEALAAHWRRRDQYYGPDGKRLEESRIAAGRDGSSIGDSGDEDRGDSDNGDGEDNDGNGEDEATPPDSPTSEAGQSRSSFSLVDPGDFSPLEDEFRALKPDDMGEEEVEEVVQMMRWILQLDVSKRPSAEAVLAHPWFSL